jgi:hypothetical protein
VLIRRARFILQQPRFVHAVSHSSVAGASNRAAQPTKARVSTLDQRRERYD